MYRTIKSLFFMIFTCFLSPCFAQHALIFTNFSQGILSGFTQTPQGGTSGSTSFHRPSFNELHIHQDTFYALGTKLFLQDYFLLIEYQHFSPQGQTFLTENLITHGKFIATGNDFTAGLDYDLYTLGIGKAFTFWQLLTQFSLESNFLKYHYDFNAFPISSARTFNVTGVNLALQLQYEVNATLFFDLKVSCPIPITNLTVFSSELGLNKIFTLKGLSIVPHLGLGVLQLDYEDNQAVPNHMRYTQAPYLSLGLILSL
ncbi:MAG: hypothetical protein JSS07_02015 [Proteobacteria bacterium]|nr:hypothetical protein [Pseudomonadota bacterium]